MRVFITAFAAFFLSISGVIPTCLQAQIDVTTFFYDNLRDGQNTHETVLTPANVNKNQFGKLFSTNVDGFVYAQPLYVANVQNIAGGTHNVLYIVTEHDSVYAIDADSGAILWQLSLINPAAEAVTLTNSSASSALVISSIAVSGGYVESNNCSSPLAAGGKCTITVNFTPLIAATSTGVLSIYDNASDSPQLITLSGVGFLPLSVAPATINPGKIAVGNSSASFAATVRNNSSATVNFSYTASSDFSAAPGATNGCGSSLPGNSSCTIAVTFNPTESGPVWGTLAVSGPSFTTQLVNLTGTGTGGGPATLSFQPGSLSFSNQEAGTSSLPTTVTVTNKGGSPVTLSSLTASTGSRRRPAASRLAAECSRRDSSARFL